MAGTRFGFKNRFYWGRVKQAAYGTANPLTSGIHIFDLDGSNPPLRSGRVTVGDGDRANGSEAELRAEGYDRFIKGSQIACDASYELLGLAMGYACGKDAHTTVSAEQRHAITLATHGTFPGAATVQQNLDGATVNTTHDLRALDMLVQRAELSWSGSGLAKIAITPHFSGREATAATISSPAQVVTYIPGNKINVHLATTSDGSSVWNGTWTPATVAGTFANGSNFSGGSPFSFGSTVQSGRLVIENVIAAGTDKGAGGSSGSGVYGVEPDIERRIITLELKVKLDNSTDDFVRAALASLPQYSIIVEGVNDRLISANPHCFASVIPLCRLLDAPEPSGGLGVSVDTLNFRALKTSGGTDRDIFAHYQADTVAGAYCGA